MSSSTVTTPSRPAVRERAGIALAAGLLGLPGVTIAWDLPHGGFWIGIPLAIVAMVLGLMAWPHTVGRRHWMAVTGFVLGLVEVLFVVSWMVFS